MKIYQTNSGLGYKELAYFLKLNDKEFLCIDVISAIPHSFYIIGEINYNDGLLFPEPSDYDIKNSPLYESFLFNYLLRNYIFEN